MFGMTSNILAGWFIEHYKENKANIGYILMITICFTDILSAICFRVAGKYYVEFKKSTDVASAEVGTLNKSVSYAPPKIS
jgi:hypothetical protein